jgi:hypothetical protein
MLHLSKIVDGNYFYMYKVVTGYDQELMKGRFVKLKELYSNKVASRMKLRYENFFIMALIINN